MTRILFICLGNICRSPMAEFVMKDLVEKAGIAEKFEIASAATSAEEVGNPVYPPLGKNWQIHAIPVLGKTARQMTRQDLMIPMIIWLQWIEATAGYGSFCRERPVAQGLPPDVVYQYAARCGRPVVYWKFRGHMAGCAGRLHGVVREAVPIKETTVYHRSDEASSCF